MCKENVKLPCSILSRQLTPACVKIHPSKSHTSLFAFKLNSCWVYRVHQCSRQVGYERKHLFSVKESYKNQRRSFVLEWEVEAALIFIHRITFKWDMNSLSFTILVSAKIHLLSRGENTAMWIAGAGALHCLERGFYVSAMLYITLTFSTNKHGNTSLYAHLH